MDNGELRATKRVFHYFVIQSPIQCSIRVMPTLHLQERLYASEVRRNHQFKKPTWDTNFNKVQKQEIWEQKHSPWIEQKKQNPSFWWESDKDFACCRCSNTNYMWLWLYFWQVELQGIMAKILIKMMLKTMHPWIITKAAQPPGIMLDFPSFCSSIFARSSFKASFLQDALQPQQPPGLSL